ncbi:ATP-dependent RNA helicase pitchoune [Phaffia rhodozyma]|uniref:ATP-dependent RNA helicase n=1 Tax=Phaffia rhodozyma TaxID=264483 RepID=A0A0F7SMH9_PHARH|nr:ATP-dependent RNA helicase pitchoune [Phaffia rhodozyma]
MDSSQDTLRKKNSAATTLPTSVKLGKQLSSSGIDFEDGEVISNLRRGLLSLQSTPPRQISSPPSQQGRASVAICIRLVPPPTSIYNGQGDDDDDAPATSLDDFFKRPWVNEKGVKAELLFIRRAKSKGDRWSSQLAFPGGRKNPEDESAKYTALRETWEEVGIDLAATPDWLHVGQLDDREITTSLGKRLLMILSPFVFLQTTKMSPIPELDPSEVSTLHWIPLETLLPPSQWAVISISLSPRLSPRNMLVRRFIHLFVGSMQYGAIALPDKPSATAEGWVRDDVSPEVEAGGEDWTQTVGTFEHWFGVGKKKARGERETGLRLWGLTLGMTLEFLSFLIPSSSLTPPDSPAFSPTLKTLPLPFTVISSFEDPKSGIERQDIRPESYPVNKRNEKQLNSRVRGLNPGLSAVLPRFSFLDVGFFVWVFGRRYRTIVRAWEDSLDRPAGQTNKRTNWSGAALSAFYSSVRKALICAIIFDNMPQDQSSTPRRGRGGGGGGGRGRGGSSFAPRQKQQPSASQPTKVVETAMDVDEEPVRPSTATKHLSDKRFSDFKIRSDLLAGISFERCTEVQAVTMPSILEGRDVLAQAKTGTGKTLAFLVPSIQSLLSLPVPPVGSQTSILVISPTRELAQQIATAARAIVSHLPGKLGVQTHIGGTKVNTCFKRKEPNDIVIATPGRLCDLISNYGIKSTLEGVRWLVFDEADQLLEQGFRSSILEILAALPNRSSHPRQTLLFSATIPKEVHDVVKIALLPNHQFISTLKEEDQDTHAHVDQRFAIVHRDNLYAATLKIITNEISGNRGSYKIMVFLPTANETAMAFEVFSKLDIGSTFEIHSRKSQGHRTKVTEEFRNAACGVLFTSDVTARGIDFTGVTHVIQAGLPMSTEQYVHRLGRTARAGAEGRGTLLLAEEEAFFLRKGDVVQLGIQPMEGQANNSFAKTLGSFKTKVDHVLDNEISSEIKAKTYQAWMGYRNSSLKNFKWSKQDLIDQANNYAANTLRYIGPPGPFTSPPISTMMASKMGLKGMERLNLFKEPPKGQRNRQDSKPHGDSNSGSSKYNGGAPSHNRGGGGSNRGGQRGGRGGSRGGPGGGRGGGNREGGGGGNMSRFD